MSLSLILDSKPVITVENLSKAFGGKKAVDSLSFSVPKGSLFAFLCLVLSEQILKNV